MTRSNGGNANVSRFLLPEIPSLTIDGAAVGADQTFDVTNPATGERFASAPDASPAQLDTAFEAAARAFRTWRTDDDARRAALHAMADVIAGATDEIAPILTAEQGKPLPWSEFEVQGAAGWLRYYADLEHGRQVLRDDETARVELVRAPIGPVAAIVPWNFPIFIAVAKVAAALRAGNTVVLKPSPYTPLATLRLGELVRDLLPPGVFNVISGGHALGPAVSSHPLARKISFTGSTATGKKIAAAAADDLKRITLELGGNDPAIVLDDADPGAVAEQLFATAFNNNGQACVAPKRVYVAEAMRPALVEALAEHARAAKVGDGADAGTDLGPLNNAAQRDRVRELVDAAVAGGATAVTGGRTPEGPGYFYEPTILTDLSDGARIVDEEQFGPAMPVIAYRDVEDALERANGTMFGLGASVWSADPDRAAAVAEQVDAGMTWINTHTAIAFDQPFAGAKWSGIGVEAGELGLDAYTDVRVLHRVK
jgi:acyl-CoA reductase-like NAD-dependent aldehyde dehydrogenase